MIECREFIFDFVRNTKFDQSIELEFPIQIEFFQS